MAYKLDWHAPFRLQEICQPTATSSIFSDKIGLKPWYMLLYTRLRDEEEIENCPPQSMASF